MPSIVTTTAMLIVLVILANAGVAVAGVFDGYWSYFLIFTIVYFGGWWLLRQWYLDPKRVLVRWITPLAIFLGFTRALRYLAFVRFATLASRYLAICGVLFGFAAIHLGHSFAGVLLIAVGTSSVIAVEASRK